MSAPWGHPDNPVTAFVGRHPRLCGALCLAGGAAIVWWQAVRPVLLAGAAGAEDLSFSPKLGALGFLLALTGAAYLACGPVLYAYLVTGLTPERRQRLRWFGMGLGALTAGFYFGLIAYLEHLGYAVN